MLMNHIQPTLFTLLALLTGSSPAWEIFIS